MPKPYPYRAKDGSVTWRVRFRLGGRGTKETTETFYPPNGEREAIAFARDIEDLTAPVALQRLEERHERRQSLTLDQAAEMFMAWKAPRVRSDRTIKDYRRDYRLWIGPHLGHRPLITLTRDDVRLWVDGMVAGTITRGSKPAAPKSIHDRHALLHQILKWAVTNRHITANPAEGTELPKKRKGQVRGLRLPEWQALHVALRQINPDAADLALFMMATGWRWSEAVDVTTYDIEEAYDEKGELRMWVVMSHVGRRGADNRVVSVEGGKGEASVRRVVVDTSTAAMIRQRVAAVPPGGLVFTTGRAANGLGGNRWRYSNFVRRYWDPAVKAANLARRPTPHWLRHTQVAMLNAAGASLPEIQARIGHASITTTIGVYGRMITDVQPGTLERLDAMLASDSIPALSGQLVPGDVDLR